MRPRNHLDGIQVAFDDHRLVDNAGLLLPATLALHLGLSQLVQQRLDLGDAPGRANTGDKIMTLVASALAGGDCIDDADALRAGGTAGVLERWQASHTPKARASSRSTRSGGPPALFATGTGSTLSLISRCARSIPNYRCIYQVQHSGPLC